MHSSYLNKESFLFFCPALCQDTVYKRCNNCKEERKNVQTHICNTKMDYKFYIIQVWFVCDNNARENVKNSYMNSRGTVSVKFFFLVQWLKDKLASCSTRYETKALSKIHRGEYSKDNLPALGWVCRAWLTVQEFSSNSACTPRSVQRQTPPRHEYVSRSAVSRWWKSTFHCWRQCDLQISEEDTLSGSISEPHAAHHATLGPQKLVFRCTELTHTLQTDTRVTLTIDDWKILKGCFYISRVNIQVCLFIFICT